MGFGLGLGFGAHAIILLLAALDSLSRVRGEGWGKGALPLDELHGNAQTRGTQQTDRVWRIGMLMDLPASDPVGQSTAIQQGLQNLGSIALGLLGLFVIASVILVLVRAVGLVLGAYKSLGVSLGAAIVLLLGTVIGSFLNIPIADLPNEHVVSGHVIELFGMQFAAPDSHRPGTVLAINVGGAVIPTLTSIYLLITRRLWIKGTVATAAVAVLMHWLATPVAGSGITVPIFLPAVAAAIIALLLSRQEMAPLAYIGGGLGTLIGADVTNLSKVPGIGLSMASIGGAGTFDGIFLTSILAVAIAGIDFQRRAARPG